MRVAPEDMRVYNTGTSHNVIGEKKEISGMSLMIVLTVPKNRIIVSADSRSTQTTFGLHGEKDYDYTDGYTKMLVRDNFVVASVGQNTFGHEPFETLVKRCESRIMQDFFFELCRSAQRFTGGEAGTKIVCAGCVSGLFQVYSAYVRKESIDFQNLSGKVLSERLSSHGEIWASTLISDVQIPEHIIGRDQSVLFLEDLWRSIVLTDKFRTPNTIGGKIMFAEITEDGVNMFERGPFA
jgi:hypothetical protein